LSVGVIERWIEQRRPVIIEKRLARLVALGDLAAPGMALRANLDLAFALPGLRAHRIAGSRVHRPGDVAAFIQAHRQTLVPVLIPGLACLLRLRPGQMS